MISIKVIVESSTASSPEIVNIDAESVKQCFSDSDIDWSNLKTSWTSEELVQTNNEVTITSITATYDSTARIVSIDLLFDAEIDLISNTIDAAKTGGIQPIGLTSDCPLTVSDNTLTVNINVARIRDDSTITLIDINQAIRPANTNQTLNCIGETVDLNNTSYKLTVDFTH